jgi:biotin operon repressor
MSKKSTKYFVMFTALKSNGGKGVSPEALQKATGFNQGALAVYIHALRHQFGAEIESVRNGRTVVAYRLMNADALASVILPTRKPRSTNKKLVGKTPVPRKGTTMRTTRVVKTTVVKENDGSIPVLDPDLDIAEIGANELDDIRHSLGI